MSAAMNRHVLRLALAILLSPLALMYLLVLLLQWLWRTTRRLAALPDTLSDVAYCSRGHPNPSIGRWRCRCSAVWEGWVFDSCPNCAATAGFFPCVHDGCGLMVASPEKTR